MNNKNINDTPELKGREWNYALKLKDLKANSVRIVNMDKVKIADLSKDNLQGE